MSELFLETEMNMRSIAELCKNSWLRSQVQFLAKKQQEDKQPHTSIRPQQC